MPLVTVLCQSIVVSQFYLFILVKNMYVKGFRKICAEVFPPNSKIRFITMVMLISCENIFSLKFNFFSIDQK